MRKPDTILTEEQAVFIKENFMAMTDKELGKELGLDEQWISAYRSRIKLLKQPPKAKVVEMDNGLFNVNAKKSWI